MQIRKPLCTFTFEHNVFTSKRLTNKLGQSFRILVQKCRTIDASDTRDYGLNTPLRTICLTHSFAQTLGFVIAGTQSIAVNVSTIALIEAFDVTAILTVNLNGRSEKQSRAAIGREL